MTIDDFDVNEISDKLAIGEETNNLNALQIGHDDRIPHDDGHIDGGGCLHDDAGGTAFHQGQTCGHDDGHFDVANHDDHDDCPFVGGQLCP